jgi:hypothetical protein
MMPVNVVKTKTDEKHWNAAKASANESGHKEDWAYVMSIYQKMKGKQHAKQASLEIINDLIGGMEFGKEAGALDALKNIGEALSYDLRLALKFPGERAFQSMLRRYDKRKIRWLTRELKNLMRGNKKLADSVAKSQAQAITSTAVTAV